MIISIRYITSKRIKNHTKGKKRPFQLEADSRIMSITRLRHGAGDSYYTAQLYLVLTSDGTCKLVSSDYDILTQCEVTKIHCPTKIVVFEGRDEHGAYIAIIDTGGYLNIFKFVTEDDNGIDTKTECKLEMVTSLRVEYGGLNAILWSDPYFYLGGDSGIIHKVKWDVYKKQLTSISSSPISTCGIVQILDGGEDCIFTLAIDQRILKISKDDDLRFIEGRVTHVADPSDFVLDETTKSFIVVGDGIETFPKF